MAFLSRHGLRSFMAISSLHKKNREKEKKGVGIMGMYPYLHYMYLYTDS
jgi:hypothetical protein